MRVCRRQTSHSFSLRFRLFPSNPYNTCLIADSRMKTHAWPCQRQETLAHSLSLLVCVLSTLARQDDRPSQRTVVRQNRPATPYPPADVRPPTCFSLLKLASSRVLELFGHMALVLYFLRPSVLELTRRLTLHVTILSACRVQLAIQSRWETKGGKGIV